MKSLFFLLLITMTSNLFAANSSLTFNMDDGSKVVVALLGEELDESEVELLWDNGCQKALYWGDFCFTGERTDVVTMLELLDDMDFLGDEFRIVKIKLTDDNAVQYQVLDGPNETITQLANIYTCK